MIEIKISEIKIKPRLRKEYKNIDSLAESINRMGQLVPIIVNERNELLAGGRRLKAFELLNKETVKAVVMKADEIESRIYEIIENLEREDFNWQEKVFATKELHEMYLAKFGVNWSERKTAEQSGISKTTINDDINLAECLVENPDVFEGCQTKQQALKALKKFRIDEAMTEMMLRSKQTSYFARVKNMLFHGDCLTLIDRIKDNSVNSVISDPIFGIEVFENRFENKELPKAHYKNKFDDSADTFLKTMTTLIKKLDRVLKKDASFALFCAFEWIPFLQKQFAEIGFDVDKLPLIWNRGANTARTNRPEKYFNRCYDFIVYGTRGNFCIVRQGLANIINIPSIPSSERFHPTQKPVELMEELLTRLCISGHIVLDPMAGSGATLVACLNKSMFPIGFELEKIYYDVAFDSITRTLEKKDTSTKE